jgi:ribosomal protein RSM22 (predicted rRNA methylase)
LAQAPCEPCFDLIIASHSINELWPDEPERIELRRNMLLSLLPALREGGILLIIEPSAHYTSIPLLALRDSLLEAARSSERENFIASAEASATSVTKHAAAHLFCVGPCPHSAPCPMRAIGNRPCFSEWKWDAPRLVRELAEMAGLDRSSLKASWVAFQKTSEKLGTDSTRELNTVFARQAASSAISGRIVSEPMLNKAGRIRYIVCTANGQLSTISAPQSDPAAMRAEPGAPDFFNLARGDLIQANELEERGLSHFGIIPSSSLKITMKAPRF